MRKYISKIGLIFLMAVVIGVISYKNVYAEEKWIEKAPLPYPIENHSAVTSNGKIYVFGGHNNIPNGMLGAQNKVLEYNPLSNTWTEKAPMPTPRFNLSVVEMNGKIYAIGGQTTDVLNTVEEYDVVTNTWTTKTGMNISRRLMSASVVNGKIYVFGGVTPDGSPAKSFEEYDPSTDKWTIKSMNSIAYQGAVSDGNSIYLVGGRNSEGIYKGLSSYDVVTGTWSELKNMSVNRLAHGTVMVDGKIYAIGGFDPKTSSLKKIEKYDPSINNWTYYGELPIETQYPATVALNGKIYVIGGQQGTKISNNVYEYNLDIIKTTLKTNVENSSIVLNWNKVDGATGYNVKRSTTQGSGYEIIASDVKETTYRDSNVQAEKTYYYVVTPIINDKEGTASNEASAMIEKSTNPSKPDTKPEIKGDAVLFITMTNGNIKSYNVSMKTVNKFIEWYKDRASGSNGNPFYEFDKTKNEDEIKTEYIVFDKISSFQVEKNK